jgi:hypothetical protein
MATNFPGNLDVLATVSDNVDDVLAAHHNNNADAIEALEVKVGIDNSTVATSIDYKIRHLPTQDVVTKVTNLNADLLDGAEGAAYFPARSGDILLSTTTVPTGWTEITSTYANKYIRVGSTGFATGGNASHTHTGSSHTHTFSATSGDHSSATGNPKNGGGTAFLYGSHTHSVSGTTGSEGTGATGSANNDPVYVDFRMYSKD